jgi:hypothetical protein
VGLGAKGGPIVGVEGGVVVHGGCPLNYA